MTLHAVERPSPNHEPRLRPVEMLVLHYTGMQDAGTAVRRLTDPAPKAGDYPGPWQAPDVDPGAALGRVSVHYVVDEDGGVLRLVPEHLCAWHAGGSSWRGRAEVNHRSVGIEIVNGGHDFGLPDFPERQIEAVIRLGLDIASRNAISAPNIVGHSDIAPDRKRDPGERFPWARLAESGLGVWPRLPPIGAGVLPTAARPGDAGEPVAALKRSLARIGYTVSEDGLFDAPLEPVVRAFQRRWRPGSVSGIADARTVLLAHEVARLCDPPGADARG